MIDLYGVSSKTKNGGATMLRIRDGIPASELTALQFQDRANFYAATDLAVERRICAEAIGDYTLIIRRADREIFNGLEFKDLPVRD